MNVISQQRQIPSNGEQLKGDDEKQGKDCMNTVFGQDQLVQIVTLTDRILVIRFQFVHTNDLKLLNVRNSIKSAYRVNGEEDAERNGNQCNKITTSNERERHLRYQFS